MADVYWREENNLVERFSPSLYAFGKAQVRAAVSELAFEVFCYAVDEQGGLAKRSSEELTAAAERSLPNVVEYVNRFSSTEKVQIVEVPAYRLNEAISLAERLYKFFMAVEKNQRLTKHPAFPGCGILAPCEADVRAGSTLYEIKAVDRNFRSVDMRQLIVYCALNRAANFEPITRIGLVNPLLGTYWVRDLDHVAHRVAGTLGAELLEDVIEFCLSPAGYIQAS